MCGLYIRKPLSNKYELSKRDEDYLRVIRSLLGGGFELSNAFASAVTMVTSSTAEELCDMFGTGNERTKKICRSLRELGLDPNNECDIFETRDATSERLLLSLIRSDNLPWPGVYAAIGWLCESGVDANAGMLGIRPLHALFRRKYSAELDKGAMELAVLLLVYGADPCALDNSGFSLLFWADLWGCIDEFQEALSRCDIDFIDVIKESMLREWHFFHPCAESTAIEEGATEVSFVKGLSRRRVTWSGDDGEDGSTEACSKEDLSEDLLSAIDSKKREREKTLHLLAFRNLTIELHGFPKGKDAERLKNLICQAIASACLSDKFYDWYSNRR